MSLTHIEYGSLASSAVMNDNFEYLDNRITTVANSLTSVASTINSNIASLNSTFSQASEELASDISELETFAQNLRNDFDSHNSAPDYSNGIGITLPYTVEADGWVYARIYTGDSVLSVFVNDKPVLARSSSQYGGITAQGSSIFRVSENDVVTTNGTLEEAYFYPMKGGSQNVLQN